MPTTKPKQRARTIIADDHALLRNGMRQMLEDAQLAEIIALAQDGLEAISLVRTHQPDLLLLDIAMPGAQGLEVFNEVRRWSPQTRVIVCTGLTSTGLLKKLITAGVDGLFMKRGDPQSLLDAVPRVLEGEKEVAKDIIALLEDAPQSSDLTPRELQILSLLTNGFSNQNIGERLGVSAKTIDNHRTNLMRKLGVHSQAELLAYALREGLIEGQKEL